MFNAHVLSRIGDWLDVQDISATAQSQMHAALDFHAAHMLSRIGDWLDVQDLSATAQSQMHAALDFHAALD